MPACTASGEPVRACMYRYRINTVERLERAPLRACVRARTEKGVVILEEAGAVTDGDDGEARYLAHKTMDAPHLFMSCWSI